MRLFSLLILFPLLVAGQATESKYFIKFTDKAGSTFSVSNPEQFLSQRAIERRLAGSIPVTDEDLPVNSHYIDSVHALGARILNRVKWFNGITIECDSSELLAIRQLPFVESDVKIFRYKKRSVGKPVFNGVPLNPNSALRISGSDYGESYKQINQLNADFLHSEGYRGEGIIIAVLDAGFYAVDQLAAFDSLRFSGNIISTWDFVDDEEMVYENSTHGMSVLSTIAGNVPGRLIGTAPMASFHLLRSEDAATENIIEEYNWAAAAAYADSAGADVISSSLGYTLFDDSTANHSYADMNGDVCPSSIAADIAFSKGMLVLSSAGNSGANSWHYIGAPSDGDDVISVGAVDSLGRHASFSSFGPAPDGRIKPNVAARGLLSVVADASGGVSKANGTSFACPILSGAASCLWQANPDASNVMIKSAIERSAHLYNNPNDSLGYGIPDFRIANYILANGNGELPHHDDLISIYPNPFFSELNIKLYSSSNQKISIEIFNATGQLVSSHISDVSAGFVNTLKYQLGDNLKQGLYFIRIASKDIQTVERLIKR